MRNWLKGENAELKGKTFENNMTGTLSYGRDFMIRPGNRMLTYSKDTSLDNKFPIKIGTELYLLVMEKAGDQIDIEGGILGVGSKVRFESSSWTSLLGSQYRSGGFTIGNQGIEILEGTEKKGEGIAKQSPQTKTFAADEHYARQTVPGVQTNVEQRFRLEPAGSGGGFNFFRVPGESFNMSAGAGTEIMSDGDSFAGLGVFAKGTRLGIEDDGTLVVDRGGENIVVSDKAGKKWVTRKVKLNGKELIVFLPTSESKK